jgi:hypothetical protein
VAKSLAKTCRETAVVSVVSLFATGKTISLAGLRSTASLVSSSHTVDHSHDV